MALPKPGDIVTFHYLGAIGEDGKRELATAPARVLPPSGDETEADMLDLDVLWPPDDIETDENVVLPTGEAMRFHKGLKFMTWQNNIPKHPDGDFPGHACWSV